MTKIYPDSEVEVQSWMAKYYDTLLNIASFGIYPSFIRKAVKKMSINAEDQILDLGAGTGRNALLMNKYLSKKGSVTGLDIGDEMIKRFEEKTKDHDNLNIYDKRIDKPLDYDEDFDKVLLSFVLHGFPHDVRRQVIENASRALRPGGQFIILDYNEFDVEDMPLVLRIPFKLLECKYAFTFIDKNWEKILSDAGFNNFKKDTFFFDYVRLLKAQKEDNL